MSIGDEMQTRVEERDHLLERATALLREDPRIIAAWLVGSHGRNSQDEWSDIDLWIVVADENIAEVIAERHEFVGRLGPVLLLEHAPQNAPFAPPGGAFLSAMFKGRFGPQIADIYWQPISQARRSPETSLLFEKLAVPEAETRAKLSDEQAIAKAIEQVCYFWLMTGITAKAIARRDGWKVLGLTALAWSGLQQARWFAGELPTAPTYRDQPAFAPPVTPSGQLAALRSMAAQMSELIQRQPALGKALDPEIAQQTTLFLSLVDESLR